MNNKQSIWYVEAFALTTSGQRELRQISGNLPTRTAAERVINASLGRRLYLMPAIVQGTGRSVPVCPACERQVERRSSKKVKCACGHRSV